MKLIFEGGVQVHVDVEATRAVYARLAEEDCTCGNCVNYRAAIRQAPRALLGVVERLGVDPLKALEVVNYQNGPEDGRIVYHAHALLVGTLLPADVPDAQYVEMEMDGVKLVMRRGKSPFAHYLEEWGPGWLDLVFVCSLPWVLGEV